MRILSELGHYLLNNDDKIMKEWLDAIQQNPNIASCNHTGEAELIDHLPSFLENIAERLKDPQLQYEDYTAVSHPGRTHGKFRWRQGYRLEEVIREAGILRGILIRNQLDTFEKKVRPLNKQARRTAEQIIHEAIEDLLGDSAEQYLQEQQKAVIHLNEQLANALAELRQQKAANKAKKTKRDISGDIES